ncbi:NAD(P)/FAD-dependent oxidoreductase [Ammoniphilus sp. CFH 90114]|uniref:phytoene desaturase family protein n=1 Tax=Ammoniphilus sp. CFH 90114 TaxID=2493665 RepID=UPI0013E939C7|nr:NAD(P)/FAD-dependent oxidoreductase [Ammoniphilus sp. CFH 90114]
MNSTSRQAKSIPIVQLEDSYDAIIVGAGIAGLFAANFLAQQGVKTLLLERHYVVGGYMQGGWERGFYFDYGIQSNEIMGGILPALEKLQLNDRVTFHPSRYRLLSPFNSLDVTINSMDGARQAFIQAFPESEAELHAYFDYYDHVYEVARLYNLKGFRGIIEGDAQSFMPNYESYWSKLPHYEAFKEYNSTISWKKTRELLGKDSRVSRILTHMGYRNQSVFATGLFWYMWCDDYYYNEGGKQALLDMLADAFTERGGTLALRASVEEIVVKDNKVRGIRLANGRMIRAHHVISNADLRHTMENLLQYHPSVTQWIEQMKNTPVSEAMFTVYLGLKMSPEELGKHLKGVHHTWFFPTHLPSPDPFGEAFHQSLPMEMSAPCLLDPKLAKEGHSTLILQTFSSYDWMQRWRIEPDGRRQRSYKELKKLAEEQLIENAAQIIPGLRSAIVHSSSATPLTHHRYTLNSGGATAGWTWNPKRTLISATDQRIVTPIENLYCAGHWTIWPGGVVTALASGKIASDLILSSRGR